MHIILKSNTKFLSCILEINNTFIDNAENVGIVMPIYNLSQCSNNYSVRSGKMWSYYINEVNDGANESNDTNNRTYSNKTVASNSF